MSQNDKRNAAGTDEEYFALLDGRRRELARARSETPRTPPKAPRPAARPARTETVGSVQPAAGKQAARPTDRRVTPAANERNRRAANAAGAADTANTAQRQRGAGGARPVPQPARREGAPAGGQQRRANSVPTPVAEADRRRREREKLAALERTRQRSAEREAAERAARERRAVEERRRAEAKAAAAKAAAERRAEAEKRRAAEERRRAAEAARQKEIRRRIREKRRAEFTARAMAAGENLLLFLVVLMIVCSAAFSILVIRLTRTSVAAADETHDYTYRVEDSSKSVSYENIVSDGVVYVDFTGIAGLCGVSVSGVRDELVFETAGGETAVFVPDSDRASVNGNGITLEGKAILRDDGHLWLPLSFVHDCFSGADVSLGEVEKRNKKYFVISVDRTPDPESTGALGKWLEPSFRLKPGSVLSAVSPDDTPDASSPVTDPVPKYDFLSDLSAFERYMAPDGTARDAYLALVDGTHRLTYRYVPAELTAVADARTGAEDMKLALFAERSLEALFTEARAAGYTTVRASLGYVSYNDRAELFDGYLSAERNFSSRNYAATGKRFSDRAYAVLGSTYLNENYVSKDSYTLSLADARRVVLSYCDEPGSDEHQSGLAVDLCDISPSAGDFASSPFAAWLKENAHKFGFVIRYPADKTAETGHAAEPWHLRYVGRYHAAAMHASGECLDEYTARISAPAATTGEGR